jgi:3-hydroxyisobutyrate dehydrogenase
MRIALIGYGEVGRILAEDLTARGHALSAFDRRQGEDAVGPAMQAHAQAHGVTLATDAAAAVLGADLVVCAVTASQAVAAARACVPGLAAGTLFLDLNSASPGSKRQAALAVEQAGARYVEAAVMTSVPPYRSRVPMLLGGAHAAAALDLLAGLGFAPRVADAALGAASATKMCRSVMVKGLEALVLESLTSARAHGVEDAVLASLQETFPGIDWERQAAYFFQRVIEHGRRRAEEMDEVAVTVAEAGLPPLAARAVAQRMAWVADAAEAGVFGVRGEPGFARSADWRVEADRLLQARPEGLAG